MNIAFLLTGYLPDVFGGAEVYTRNLAHGMNDRGHKTGILTLDLNPNSHADKSYVHEGIQIHRFALPKPWRPAPIYALQFYTHLYDSGIRYFSANKPDILHVTNSWWTAPLALAAMHSGIPCVITHVDFLWTCRNSHLMRQDNSICKTATDQCRSCFPDVDDQHWSWTNSHRSTLYRLLATGAAVHHCPCPLMARHIRTIGVSNDSICIFPYGVPDEIALPHAAKTQSSRLRLGFIGRWNKIKGIDLLLDAMSRLKDLDNISLTLFGEQESWNNDAYGAAISARAHSLPNIAIHGRFDTSELARIHGELDCLVTPSIWPENSPVSILEALALGTPVICADGEGMTNLVKNGKNGLIFRNRDSSDLADKIKMLAISPDLLHRMQGNAHCLRTIREDTVEFEKTYGDAMPCSNPHWIKESQNFVQTIRALELTI